MGLCGRPALLCFVCFGLAIDKPSWADPNQAVCVVKPAREGTQFWRTGFFPAAVLLTRRHGPTGGEHNACVCFSSLLSESYVRVICFPGKKISHHITSHHIINMMYDTRSSQDRGTWQSDHLTDRLTKRLAGIDVCMYVHVYTYIYIYMGIYMRMIYASIYNGGARAQGTRASTERRFWDRGGAFLILAAFLERKQPSRVVHVMGPDKQFRKQQSRASGAVYLSGYDCLRDP